MYTPTPPPPLSAAGGGDWRVEPSTQFSKKKGGLNRTSIFRGRFAGRKRDDVFQVGGGQ